MARCDLTWVDLDPRLPELPHQTHRCVFFTVGTHSRHECRCGLNRHDNTPMQDGVLW